MSQSSPFSPMTATLDLSEFLNLCHNTKKISLAARPAGF